jgi:hypothetical protein
MVCTAVGSIRHQVSTSRRGEQRELTKTKIWRDLLGEHAEMEQSSGQWDGRAAAARHSGRAVAPVDARSSFVDLDLGHKPGSGLGFCLDCPDPEIGGVEIWALPVAVPEVTRALLTYPLTGLGLKGSIFPQFLGVQVPIRQL